MGRRRPPVCRLALAAAAVAVLLVAPVRAAETPLEWRAEAEAAWRDGRHDAALEAYERVLAAEPDDGLALVRTAKILSWRKRWDESVERFERALELRPGDREARLGLARTLAWAGRYELSRAQYAVLLERDPGDVPALVGEGKTYAWSGRLDEARARYERALAIAPEDVDAGVGLAYVELWSGEIPAAGRRSARLSAAHPEHGDVAELRRRVREATGPRARGWAERTSDTDDNDLDVVGIRGGWRPRPSVELSAGLAHYEMSDPTGDASIDAVDAELVVEPNRGHRLTLFAGVDRRETTSGDSESETLGGVRWELGPARRWPVRLWAARTPIRYSPTITDNGITFDEIGAGVRGRVGERWRLDLSAAAADLSDDNERVTAVAAARYAVRRQGPAVALAGTLRFMDYDRDSTGGYFDPSGFVAALVGVTAHGTFGASATTWRVELTAGAQSFTRGQETPAETDVNGDGVVIVSSTLGFPLGRGAVLEAYGTWGDYAAQNAGGFESTTAGLRVVWRGGGR